MEFKHNFGEISMGKTLRCLADSTSPLLQRLCVICALAALFASHCFMCKIPDNMENLTTSITNNLPTDYEIHSWNKTKMCNKEDVQNFLEKAQEIIEIFDGKMKNESFIKQDISKVQRSVKDFSTCISMETLAQNFCLRFQPNLPQNFFGDLHSIMLNISLNIPSPQNKCLCFLEFLTSPKPTNDMTGKSTTLPNTEEVHTQEATVTDQTTSYQPPLKNPLKHHETDGWKRMAIISMSLCIILLFILVALLLYYRQLTQREGYTGPRRNEIA